MSKQQVFMTINPTLYKNDINIIKNLLKKVHGIKKVYEVNEDDSVVLDVIAEWNFAEISKMTKQLEKSLDVTVKPKILKTA